MESSFGTAWRAEVEAWTQSADKHWPAAEVTPRRVYVSVDGIMYCTNEREPHPDDPTRKRLKWQQMRVGCVYWQDEQERWHKQMIWGREEASEFGASLDRLACRCGYREADEILFAADGGEWCWSIHQQSFAAAQGILGRAAGERAGHWYHASEHLWDTARVLHADDDEARRQWADQALTRLHEGGGCALLEWLTTERSHWRCRKRKAVTQLMAYVQPHLDRTDDPTYLAHGWQIGSGMIESTAKHLVGLRLKGPGMHWSESGAPAVTALRANDLNGHWHQLWNTLTLNA